MIMAIAALLLIGSFRCFIIDIGRKVSAHVSCGSLQGSAVILI